ncbi:MAG: hypothetical protein HYT22_00085 [Candidatus Niyogibacteria bacterium]|nr:hypothetical protein [Candidatus Niyogibacteria bacterium]
MNLWAWITEYFESIAAWPAWTWQAPAFAALGIFAVLAILRPRQARFTLEHPEGHWLYRASAWSRCLGFLLRWLQLALLFVAALALALFFARPVEVRTQKHIEQGDIMISSVVDLSGSIGCLDYLPIFEYFDAVLAQKEKSKTPIFLGLYYFSNSQLFEIFPTDSERRTRIAVEYGPTCYANWTTNNEGMGGVGVGTSAKIRLEKMKKIRGAAGGTEPGPSMWNAMLDLVRYERPDLAPRVAALADAGALLPNTPAIAMTWTDEKTQRELCDAMRGKRMVLLTDTEFSLKTVTNPTSFTKVMELASLLCLPVDIVATGSVREAEALGALVKKTGGRIEVRGAPMEKAAERMLASAAKSAPPLKVRYEPLTDSRPQRALLALAFAAATVLVILRSFSTFIGW